MAGNPNKLSQFWQELKRRKILPFLIAYIAACFAIIEFFDITSERFTIPDNTFTLLYILAVIGLPVVVVLPWFINRKKPGAIADDSVPKEASTKKEEAPAKHNLPAQLSTFIGRENEMQIVKELIMEHRLVTLTGAGGCGKTRLSCEVVATLITEYKDGVWFVELAPISDGNLVTKEIMEVLDIKEVTNQPIIETLIDQIKEKSQLIVLDNCEHLIKSCAEIVGKLLHSIPGLKILVTSREALNITGEQVWRVPSLTLIDPKTIVNVEQAKDSEAVLLFTDRAKLNNPEFELETANVNEVATICNKLDGIPLALELVASRIRHMNPQMILERFENRFDKLSSSDPGTSKRQQTLQATIEWSYNLLSTNEKLLFTRLAVFSGGFDIEAAEEVCSDDQLLKESIMDILSRLVDQSLVYTIKSTDQSMRYNRLETLQQFAWQKLQSQKEDQTISNQHLQYYLKLAEQAYKEQFESQSKWLNKLEQEHDNLIAALNWSDNHSPEEFIKLSGVLYWFWRLHSHILLGKDYLERGLLKDANKSEAYARVAYGLGYILLYTGEATRALNLMKESLDIWHKCDNLWEEAIVLSGLGWSYDFTGDHETALGWCQQGLEIARKVDNPGLINHCLAFLCQLFINSKQYERGRPLVEELLVSSEKLEQPFGIVGARHLLSDCSLGIKNYKEAEKLYATGIETALKYNNPLIATFDLQGVAFALSGQSRWAKCIRLNAASCEKATSIGISTHGVVEFWDEWIDTFIEGAKKKVGEELAKQYEKEGEAMGFEKAVEYAIDFEKD